MTQERYKNGKIYRLINTIDSEEYIGSTCNRLSHRLSGHKADAKTKGDIKVYKHLNEVGWDNVKIILIQEFPCESKMELERQEAHWIRELKPSLNCKIPRRTNKEWREDNKEVLAEKHKEYYEKNKNNILEYHKEYNEKNKEVITEKNKAYYEKTKEVFAEYRKEYYQQNKEARSKYYKEWQEKNKDAIAEKKKAYYQRKKAEQQPTTPQQYITQYKNDDTMKQVGEDIESDDEHTTMTVKNGSEWTKIRVKRA